MSKKDSSNDKKAKELADFLRKFEQTEYPSEGYSSEVLRKKIKEARKDKRKD